jgi:hypothetical protein
MRELRERHGIVVATPGQQFARVVFLAGTGFAALPIALTVGLSSANVRTYLEIYEARRWQSRYADRYREIALIGDQHFRAEDQKRRPALRPPRSSGARRRPKSQALERAGCHL